MDATLLVTAPSAIDQERIARLLGNGLRLSFAGSLVETVRAVLATPPDAVLVMMDRSADPATDCELLRALGDFPLILAWRDLSPEAAAACLDRGVDAALALDTPEFGAHVHAVLRRAASRDLPHPERRLVAGDLLIDLEAHLVRWRGRLLDVTPIEFQILAALAEHPGRVMTNRELLTRVWGPEYADDVHYVRLYIGYLRNKLEDDPHHPHVILNQWGIGYRLGVEDAVAVG